jgi:circadian clock protein KaiC
MLTRLIDFFKSSHVTAMFSDLTLAGNLESSNDGISSRIDTWICLRDVEHMGERNRGLYMLESRGIAHSMLGICPANGAQAWCRRPRRQPVWT